MSRGVRRHVTWCMTSCHTWYGIAKAPKSEFFILLILNHKFNPCFCSNKKSLQIIWPYLSYLDSGKKLYLNQITQSRYCFPHIHIVDDVSLLLLHNNISGRTQDHLRHVPTVLVQQTQYQPHLLPRLSQRGWGQDHIRWRMFIYFCTWSKISFRQRLSCLIL